MDECKTVARLEVRQRPELMVKAVELNYGRLPSDQRPTIRLPTACQGSRGFPQDSRALVTFVRPPHPAPYRPAILFMTLVHGLLVTRWFLLWTRFISAFPARRLFLA